MPFRRKILYYALMLFLTLIAIEGMARVAHYAAYGQGYDGRLATETMPSPPPHPIAAEQYSVVINHPFYGFVPDLPYRALNEMPPRPRREDIVIVGLTGGSVAAAVQPFLERALNRWFAANRLPRRPVVLNLAAAAAKQPQQTLIVANTLLLGGEFDLIVNLDGFNEVAVGPEHSLLKSVFPFFPHRWKIQTRLTTGELLLAGQIGVLRREQGRLAAAGATSPLRRSALFRLVNHWRQERIAAEITQRNHELAALKSQYKMEKHGPRTWLEREDLLLPEAARVWYRGSIALARLAALAGAEYYHFLQPNQYAPDSKPLSAEEQELYSPHWGPSILSRRGYPLLTAFNRELQSQGINYFDLTRIFIDHRETLYLDKCCHLNGQGNELLAAAMVQRMAPALRRLGAERPAVPVSALAAARRPAEPVSALAATRRPAELDTLLAGGDFQVYLQGDGKWLRYVRGDCAAGDTAARFFLHLTPRDLADLPPHRRGHGFDNLDFSFGEAGGLLWRGQCLAQIPLPDYPLAYLRTGQYAAEVGELWAGGFAFE